MQDQVLRILFSGTGSTDTPSSSLSSSSSSSYPSQSSPPIPKTSSSSSRTPASLTSTKSSSLHSSKPIKSSLYPVFGERNKPTHLDHAPQHEFPLSLSRVPYHRRVREYKSNDAYVKFRNREHRDRVNGLHWKMNRYYHDEDSDLDDDWIDERGDRLLINTEDRSRGKKTFTQQRLSRREQKREKRMKAWERARRKERIGKEEEEERKRREKRKMDMSRVRAYLERQWTKILLNKVNLTAGRRYHPLNSAMHVHNTHYFLLIAYNTYAYKLICVAYLNNHQHITHTFCIFVET